VADHLITSLPDNENPGIIVSPVAVVDVALDVVVASGSSSRSRLSVLSFTDAIQTGRKGCVVTHVAPSNYVSHLSGT
jgi:hypothetical protein